MLSHPTFKEAALRALFGAFILAGVDFFTALATAADWRVLAATTGGTFFGYLAIRMVGEGYVMDYRRAVNGQTRPADVGQTPARNGAAPR